MNSPGLPAALLDPPQRRLGFDLSIAMRAAAARTLRIAG